jgi:hypothetical protein
MGAASRTSGQAAAALLAGLLSVACGVLALASESDLFLLGVVLCWLLALVLGVWSWVAIGRASGRLRGKTLAGWGMGAPLVGFGLGFLLLPAT